MNTIIIKRATAPAVAKELYSAGFIRYEVTTGVGIKVEDWDGTIFVSNRTYSEGTAAQELEARGYIIEDRFVSKSIRSGIWLETFHVSEKVTK